MWMVGMPISCAGRPKTGATIKKVHKRFRTLKVYARAARKFWGKGHKILNKVSK